MSGDGAGEGVCFRARGGHGQSLQAGLEQAGARLSVAAAPGGC